MPRDLVTSRGIEDDEVSSLQRRRAIEPHGVRTGVPGSKAVDCAGADARLLRDPPRCAAVGGTHTLVVQGVDHAGIGDVEAQS